MPSRAGRGVVIGGGRRAGQNEALPARGSPITTAVPSAWARGAGAPSGGAAALARTATQEEEELAELFGRYGEVRLAPSPPNPS